MKLLGISLLITCLLAGIEVGMNMLMGEHLYQSFQDMIIPFHVMEATELFILFLFLLLWGIDVLMTFLRQKQTRWNR
jgi:hypothetical protein